MPTAPHPPDPTTRRPQVTPGPPANTFTTISTATSAGHHPGTLPHKKEGSDDR
jgi:hypothetical protein